EPRLDAVVVDEVARLEVARPVEHDVRAGREIGEVLRVDVRRVRLDARRTADPRERFRRGVGLLRGFTRVAFLEEHLARKVRLLDDVAVDEHEAADAAADERLRDRAAERAAADEERALRRELLLSARAEPREADLPGKTAVERRAHAAPRWV